MTDSDSYRAQSGPRMPGAGRMESSAIDCCSGAFSNNSASPLAAWRCTLPIVVLRAGKRPGRAWTRVRSTPASGAPRFRLQGGGGIATGHRCVHPETQTPRKGSRVRCWTAVGNRFPDPVAGLGRRASGCGSCDHFPTPRHLASGHVRPGRAIESVRKLPRCSQDTFSIGCIEIVMRGRRRTLRQRLDDRTPGWP